MQRKIRVLVGKPGLDGHDRGAKVVAAALRDAGMEVIYTGLHQTPEQIVEAATQEDVDVVALSILSGAHMTLFPDVQKLMRQRGIGDRLLTGGGIIPPEDMEKLAKLGIGRLFGPGASTQDIAAYIREWFENADGNGNGQKTKPAVAPARGARASGGVGRERRRLTAPRRGPTTSEARAPRAHSAESSSRTRPSTAKARTRPSTAKVRTRPSTAKARTRPSTARARTRKTAARKRR